MATDTQVQMVREDPRVEAYKLQLMQAATQLQPPTLPTYAVAGLSQNQLDAIGLGQAGIGAYQPYLNAAVRGTEAANEAQAQAMQGLAGADTRKMLAEAALETQRYGQANIQPAQSYMTESVKQMNAAQQLPLFKQGIESLYQAADLGQQVAQGAQGQTFIAPGVAQAYMSPYMQEVVDVQQREARRQAEIAAQAEAARYTAAGAFGGSRQGLAAAESNRNLLRQLGDIQATGSQAAYQQAQQQFNAEQANRLQGGQLGLQAANMYGTAAQGALGVAGLQAQLGQSAAQYAGNVGQQLAGQEFQQKQLAQQAIQNYANLANQQFAQGQAISQGIGALGMNQAQLAAQNASLGSQATGLGQQDVSFLYNLGTMQQKQQQAELDAARATAMQNVMQPYQQLSFLSDIYRGAPSSSMAMTQQSTPTASPFQQIAGLGIAGVSAAAAGAKAGLF